jgi:putative FmdB family regulatory protein
MAPVVGNPSPAPIYPGRTGSPTYNPAGQRFVEVTMPIYAYKCSSCGHDADVLQKVSDAPLVDCPACGAASFSKQLTAAGFQLKGSGWYATDFKNGTAKPAAKPADGKPDSGEAAPATAEPAAKPAPATAAAAAPACGSGGCAACT